MTGYDSFMTFVHSVKFKTVTILDSSYNESVVLPYSTLIPYYKND